MENTLKSSTLSSLKLGQTLLYRFVKTIDDEGDLEFAEIVHTGGTQPKHMLHASTWKSKPRRGWENCVLTDAEEYLGIEVPDNWEIDDKGKEYVELNILNPTAMNMETGQIERFRLQIIESIDPDAYQLEHWRRKAKKSKDGDYYKHKDKLIYSNTEIVFNKAEHVWLKHDNYLSGLIVSSEEYEELVKTKDLPSSKPEVNEADFKGISKNDIFSKV